MNSKMIKIGITYCITGVQTAFTAISMSNPVCGQHLTDGNITILYTLKHL